MRTRLRAAAYLVVAAGLPAPVLEGAPPARTPPAASSPARVPREGIEALEAQLDRAIDRVSLPRPAALLGREAARGYRLPGYGVVFVLTPRTLPGPNGFDVLRPRHRVEFRHVAPRPPEGDADGADDVGALERQVIVLQHETELARRAAEEDQERIVQNVRVRLAPPGELHVEVTTPGAGEAPATQPAPPVPPAPRAPVAHPAPAAPVAPAGPPELPAAPEAPQPPPWKFWFDEAVPRDTRTPDAVVGDVRRVLVEALESGPGRVPGLLPDEFVTVAVDFEPAGLFAQRARPEKTLVVRARVRDLEARARGAIPPEELRRRVEVIEY